MTRLHRPGRLDAFGTTIFAEMSALAVRTGSINLGQGFPDTDGPAELLAAAGRAIAEGRGNQYPPGPGIPELRRAIAEHQQAHYGLRFDPDTEVLVTVGATEAIASAILGLTMPGDEVVTFEPYYDSYAASIALGGAERRVVTLRPDAGRWSFDPAELRAAITSRTRLILLNSPHNPTGTVFNREELGQVADLAIEHDLIVVTDEVYEHLVFDGEHIPLATLPGMAERTLTISSAGKTFSVTGWKVGWICAPAELLAGVRAVKQFLTFVGSGPFQYAIAEGLGYQPQFYTEVAEALRVRRDLLVDGLCEQGYSVMRPQATYFATVDLGGDAEAWCRALPEQAGVVAIPSRVFYDSDIDRYARFAFCKRLEVLDEALTRLGKLAR
ncbi:MAG: pyridoxal phosphate-dependent aminotransferase [Actinomycetota bacterium]|nr:pyridoxal phosphate-dependent aminotransferase [Actinomycetota bacterium]MDQ2959020.1 pyridoxal phosphate-dependent aminotransferase [Actinomycetota bacterium]